MVGADLSRAKAERAASVAALWRYPVKSMLGEELHAAEVTAQGLAGGRRFAVRDRETGKVVGAKNPRKWADFFAYSAVFVAARAGGAELPAGTFFDCAVVHLLTTASLELRTSGFCAPRRGPTTPTSASTPTWSAPAPSVWRRGAALVSSR